MSVPAEANSADESLGSKIGSLHRQARYTRWFRWHLAAALAVFFASAFGGYAIFGSLSIDDLIALMPQDSPLANVDIDFAFIMFNNLRVLLMVLLGSITGGLLSLFVLFTNGIIVGAVVGIVVQQTSWAVILAALLPHGILELSAFFMAAAIGLRVPHRIVRYLLGWDETPLTRVEAFEILVLGVVLVAMIVVAAWIEVNVTPRIIEMVDGGEVIAE